MSGGVDSAAAAQLSLDAGDEVVAVTLELWSDPATDGEQSCCSPQAVSRRSRPGPPDGHPARDARPARALPRRGGGRRSSTATRRAARPTRACAATARSASTPCSSWPDALGAARLATGHYARIARDEHGPLIRAAADTRQGPELHARQARPGAARQAQLPARRPHQGLRARARARGGPAGGRQAREPGPLLRRRPRRPRLPSAPRRAAAAQGGRDRGPPGPCGRPPRRPPQLHRRPAPRPRASPRPSRCTCSRRMRPRIAWSWGPREELATRRVPLEATTLHRPAAEVELVRLRSHAESLPCRAHVKDDGSIELELERPASAVAPGQLACLMRQDRVVGEGTIGEPR